MRSGRSSFGTVRIYDDSVGPAHIDGVSQSLQIIDFMHHELHEGDHYHLEYLSGAIASGSTAELRFQTPNTTARVHLVGEVVATGEFEVRFYEDTTKTHVVGNVLTPKNNERASANTSGVTACHTPAGAGAGTLIWGPVRTGAGRVGGAVGREDEQILKVNTAYLFEITSRAAGTYISFALRWYEHTPEN